MKLAVLKYTISLLLFTSVSFSQSHFDRFLTPSDTLNKPRRNAVAITEASIAGLSLVGLNQLWYADFDRSKFHTINDNNEWLQMDKMGHVFTSYQMGKAGAELLNWSGVSKKDQLVYGATLGFGFLTAVEILDGYSEEWGFSWGDIAANAAGTGLYVGQELLWKEQRVALKFSFHETRFAAQRPDKLGENLMEQILKDYNGQTYWLSANIHSFFKQTRVPKWLNVAFGYGGEGMLSGNNEPFTPFFADGGRNRQFYLSFDVDFSRMSIKSRVLRVFLNFVNMIKIPFPTLEFSKKGAVFHLFYY